VKKKPVHLWWTPCRSQETSRSDMSALPDAITFMATVLSLSRDRAVNRRIRKRTVHGFKRSLPISQRHPQQPLCCFFSFQISREPAAWGKTPAMTTTCWGRLRPSPTPPSPLGAEDRDRFQKKEDEQCQGVVHGTVSQRVPYDSFTFGGEV